MYRLVQYETPRGKAPFRKWRLGFRDKQLRGRIRARLDRLRLGNFGDIKSLGEELFELRIHAGAGYRIYFAMYRQTIVVLLAGGSKASQKRDIQQARKYWQDFLRRNQ